MRNILLVIVSIVLLAGPVRVARGETTDKSGGTVAFRSAGDEAAVPAQFRLEPHSFDYQLAAKSTSSAKFRLAYLTFPSPVVTPHVNNNTVHCEYFCPLEAGRHPAVIVLHILGGDFELSRLFCRGLASNGVAALFLKMPYYGERRQSDAPARMVNVDPNETVAGMTQAVLDIRRAAAWLAEQPQVDPQQVGILGISLGGITAALVSSVEPRFHKACLILAGGDMGEVAWTSTELKPLRKRWAETGHTKEELFAALRCVDPISYAKPLASRRVLMLNASHDEVIPRACTDALWKAFGEPEIVWWDAGHYTAARYMFDGLAKAVAFFQPDG